MIGILCEKPSAAKNFAKALGGTSGSYNGESYVIAASVGHIYEYDDPSKQVQAVLVPKYKSWELDNLPWNESDFKWKRSLKKDKKEVLDRIKKAFSGCDEIVIATDVDPTGEGELLAWEILLEGNIKARKYSRMYFVDEAASSIQKAFKTRQVIGSADTDMDYVKALYRSKFDFMTMQFTRIATKCGDGFSVLRQGRLKSAMVFIVGDQLAKIAAYKKVPFYSNKFKDTNGNIFTNPEEPIYPKKEDVPKKYSTANVVVDSKTMKTSAPPKLIDLAMLSSLLASKGIKSKDVLNTYQKMYENQVVSYPRTEDKEITPEQFNEMLPKVDSIAKAVGVDTSLLTHRTPRKTHVKTGGSHGANRPGPNVPKSLDAVEADYGKTGRMIYEILAHNFLSMFGEDYEYEQQKAHLNEYPDFKSTCSVPKKLGYKAIFKDEDDELEDSNDKGFGATADPFIHEGFPPKPATPTQKWLMKQLESHDVGTGATRTSIFGEVTDEKAKYPLLIEKKGKISMSKYGNMSYYLLKDTNIGSLEITEKLQKDMRDIAAGTANPDVLLAQISKLVVEDISTMKRNSITMKKELGVVEQTEKERYTGEFNGKSVTISRVYGGHRFTDEELEKLFNGEEIEVSDFVSKDGKTYGAKGKLAEQEYKGKTFWGFSRTGFLNSGSSDDVERYTGKFKGKEITIKREWRGHRFTDEELKDLFAGKEIDIFGLKSAKTGKEYGQRGKLAQLEYNGHKYWGFQNTGFPESNKDGSGRPKSVPKSWCQHEFTQDEINMLEAGAKVFIEGCVSKKGNAFSCNVTWTPEEGIKPEFN